MATNKKRQTSVVSISHACTQCGNCCRERGDIFLTPLDVLHISQLLEISCENFIQNYCIRSGLEVSLKATGNQNECIFLHSDNNGRCSCAIYNARPMPCYLFPLASTGSLNSFSQNYSQFCSTGKTISVTTFVNQHSSNRYPTDFIVLQKFLHALFILEQTLNSDADTEKAFKFLFYNNSEEEISKKLDSFLIK